MPPLFHVVMHEPEIPNNTGNIGRTCIAAGCALHLIRPLGFDTSEKALRRAGLDYWPRLAVTIHDDWPAFLASARPARLWLTSGGRGRPAWDADLRPGDALVFGKETAGLPAALLDAHADRVLTLPMLAGERGLNVATAVCAVVYEGIRQCVARGDRAIDPAGRLA
jgi:tRNA (cytidine/uridine-2'-O-)-methyltransferase